jgi:hypothetical protein
LNKVLRVLQQVGASPPGHVYRSLSRLFLGAALQDFPPLPRIGQTVIEQVFDPYAKRCRDLIERADRPTLEQQTFVSFSDGQRGVFILV